MLLRKCRSLSRSNGANGKI
ncbi:hypothetical protein QLX08_006564 [Tetragonisca angustula]|uniref:Uncharacterized protein n=1 Tax=Tetragonisca angustula TaxID=166442 RepID=A0AAW0ZW28_9HYME